jgi:hypothetical protein
VPDVTEELFTVLRYHSEVREEGLKLISRHVPQSDGHLTERLYSKFRASLRQGEDYYRAARILPFRSNALLYYYSFMHLAKACLIAHGLRSSESHGLVFHVGEHHQELSSQTVRVEHSGIFPVLYRFEFGEEPGRATFSVGKLLGYISEISYQYAEAELGAIAIHPGGRLRFLANIEEGTHWSVLAIPRTFEAATLPEPFRSEFDKRFELVAFGKDRARTTFNMLMPEFSHFDFYENKETFAGTAEGEIEGRILVEHIHEALPGCLTVPYIEGDEDFILSRPYEGPGRSWKMNECMAIYLVMFFLGSLVRYRPDYLDALLGSKAAWILESFVNGSPLVFLRLVTSRIIGRDYIFNR